MYVIPQIVSSQFEIYYITSYIINDDIYMHIIGLKYMFLKSLNLFDMYIYNFVCVKMYNIF